jgi:CzcA family heavy metal efflux pump
MLASIVRFSIRFRGVVLALTMLLVVYGIYDLSRAGLDIFPEFSPKQVIIQTESPGLASDQVEILVTQPIETALSGLIGLRLIRSESIQGLSIITVIFQEETDIYRDRQLVSERLAGITARLPAGIGPPVPLPLSSSSATVLTIGLTAKPGGSAPPRLMELRKLADWNIVPRVLAVPGVADVNVFGGEIKQLQIQVDSNQLRRFGLGIDAVVHAARQATGLQSAGFLENRNQRITLHVSGHPVTPEALARIVLKRSDDGAISLGDVATITIAPAPPIGAAAIMGEPAVVMMVIGQYGANTLTVSRRVEKVLEEFEHRLGKWGIQLHPRLFRPADYIETSLHNLLGHLMIGAVFVLLVLYAVLFNVRTAFISAVAIPMSLLGAVIVLLAMGINLNIMVLGGLAIALGEVVDDAIIDTENIFRRLRENCRLPKPRPAGLVVFDASMEVRGSVVYATFIVALVFVPLLTLGGVAGRLFSPLGSSYILATLVSLGVALTLTPALCYLLLGNLAAGDDDPPLVRWVKPRYGALLRTISAAPKTVLIAATISFLAALSLSPLLGGQFLPELREGHYIVHTTAVPGTALHESIRIGNQLTKAFLQIPGVQSVSQWAGRAERSADTYGSHYSEYEVRLDPMSGREQQAVLGRLRSILERFPGVLFEANTFLTERIDETISGYTAPVVVNLYGNDLNQLDRAAQAVAAAIRTIPGATDVQLRSPAGAPLLQIRLRLEQLSHWGLRPAQVIDAIQAAHESAIVGKIIEEDRTTYDVAVILPPEQRQHPNTVGQLPVRTPNGTIITVGDIADIRQSAGRYNILHQGGQRLQTITCNVDGRGLNAFMTELKQRIHEEVDLRADIYPEFTGAAVEQAAAKKELILHAIMAGIGVLVLIYIAIGSIRHTLLALLNLPFSMVGGVAAVLLTGATLSVGSVVGFVTLFGITVRNSIMLISHYQQLVDIEGKRWNLDTAVQGAQERLPPILMTALVTALAMLPIAIDSDNPGREIMGAMATIIIGGLASSTMLNLLLLPTILLRYGRFDSRPVADRQ